MANKQLTAKVKLNISDAEKKLKKLNTLFQKLDKATNSIGNSNKVEKQLSRSERKLRKIVNNVRSWKSAQQGVTSATRATDGVLSSISRKIRNISATYLGIMGLRGAITTSDTITKTQNKLNNLNGGDINLTQHQMDQMYTSANKVRMAYTDMMANASKSMVLAGDAFGGNMDNAIRFQEIMAESYALGGASAQEMSSSMYQIIQALGSGTLAGDELRSVREGAPLAYREIEKFAQGIYNTTDSLKDMASQGLITSEIVVAAIMDAGGRIDTQFENTAVTFEQAWDRIKNSAVKAFEPVSIMLNEMLNRAVENGAFEKIEQAFWTISKVLQIVFQIIYNIVSAIGTAVNWVVDNWNWLGKVILSILAVVGTTMAVILFPKFVAWLSYIAFAIKYYVWLGATALASAFKTAAAWAIANWQMLLIIVVIAAVIVAIIWLADSFADACGMIVGVIMTALAFVWNEIVGVVNAIIQFLWTCFVEPWIGVIEWVLNVFNGGFNSFGDGVKNLLGNIISWFLSLGQVVTKIIDAIFGTNWTGGLEALKGKVLSWGKNENAITLNREAPTILNRVSYSDAYNKGYEWGFSGGEWLSNKFGSIGNLDKIGDKLGLNFGNGFGGGSADISDAYNMPENLATTADNTGKIADSMELAEEDLSYLRRIAEMEWKKEYTTASITVDMSNYNNISGETDLDGIVTKLADKLYEEMNVVANGVYV